LKESTRRAPFRGAVHGAVCCVQHPHEVALQQHLLGSSCALRAAPRLGVRRALFLKNRASLLDAKGGQPRSRCGPRALRFPYGKGAAALEESTRRTSSAAPSAAYKRLSGATKHNAREYSASIDRPSLEHAAHVHEAHPMLDVLSAIVPVAKPQQGKHVVECPFPIAFDDKTTFIFVGCSRYCRPQYLSYRSS